ncbi:MAG TPA: hypothetical protein VFB62_13370 [Polyangiaceae bacterium]|jgi:hypothetical protein|nr:hypothetical protein [Polyangiaceae bacterium]
MPLTHGPDAKPHWRYLLHVEIHPTDAAVLKDALEDEPFGLKKRLGAAELNRQIDHFEISVDAHSLERWDDFDHDIEILSVYLSEYIEGTEIHVQPTKGAPVLHAWKVVGRRGEVVRLEREVHWEDESIVLGDEHLEPLKKRWASFPEWVRDAMRLKYPRLREL